MTRKPRRFTKAQLRRAARDRLENPAPMRVTSPPPGSEARRVGNEFRLIETKPAHLEVTELRPRGAGPYRLYVIDGWDSDFEGADGTSYSSFEAALAAAKEIGPGYRAYIDNGKGHNVCRIVHQPRERVCW